MLKVLLRGLPSLQTQRTTRVSHAFSYNHYIWRRISLVISPRLYHTQAPIHRSSTGEGDSESELVFDRSIKARVGVDYVQNTECDVFMNKEKGTKYIRQYFYYINKDGQLFLHDSRVMNFTSCLKEIKFLDFFFKRLRANNTGSYEEFFKYISPCGKELNFIEVEDTPYVFHTLKEVDGEDVLIYAGSMSVPFDASQLYMSDEGRIYHPGPKGSLCLLRSALAVFLGKRIRVGGMALVGEGEGAGEGPEGQAAMGYEDGVQDGGSQSVEGAEVDEVDDDEQNVLHWRGNKYPVKEIERNSF